MNKKKIPWAAVVFVAYFCLVMSGLSAIFAGHSAKLDKIYFVTKLIGGPALFLYLGFRFRKLKPGVKTIMFHVMGLALCALIVLVFNLIMKKSITLQAFTDEYALMLTGLVAVLSVLAMTVHKLPKAVYFVLFLVACGASFIPALKGTPSGLLLCTGFYFLGALSFDVFSKSMSETASELGMRYIAVLACTVFLRQLVFQGWWMRIIRNMSESHWIMIYTLVAAAAALMAMSWCADLIVNMVLWPAGRFGGQGKRFGNFFANFGKYRFLLRELIKKGIVLKYRRSFFGILWSLLEPLLTMVVLTFVFSNFFGSDDPYYPVFILTGRLMFSLFQSTTTQAMKSVRGNAAMIKKVYVPKYMYPVSSIMFNFILFLISLIDLVLVMFWFKVPVSANLLLSGVPILVLLIFSIGVGMILATVNVFFRDIEYLWGVFCLLLMYSSAIFYKPDRLINSTKGWILELNPVYQMIYNFRQTVIYGHGLDAASMMFSVTVSLIVLFIGFAVFYKKQDEFILHI